MLQLCISDEIHAACPAYVAAVVEAGVTPGPTPAALLDEMAAATEELRHTLTPDGVKALPAVAATRAAYRRCGKDPGRYRPSGEQLMRRVVQGKDLYVVDAGRFVLAVEKCGGRLYVAPLMGEKVFA